MVCMSVGISDMAKILLVGCGDIGLYVAQHLIANGHDIWAIRRNTQSLQHIYRLTPVQMDITRPGQSLPSVDFDYIFFILTPASRDELGYRSIFIDGVGHVLSMVKNFSLNIKRCFFVSSTSVYHQDAGEWVDENAVTHPQRFNGRVLVEAENLVRSTFPTTTVRFSGIYSADRLMLLQRSQSAESFRVHWTNRIHRDDCAGFLSYLVEQVEHGVVLDPCYIASDSEPAIYGDVINWLRQQQSLPIIKALNNDVNKASGKRCVNKRMLDLGYEPRYPSFREGYQSILALVNRGD